MYEYDLRTASRQEQSRLVEGELARGEWQRTRVGPIIMHTHRDNDMSSLASRPHDTELKKEKVDRWEGFGEGDDVPLVLTLLSGFEFL